MTSKIIITLYISAFIALSVFAFLKPSLNWDLVAYAGCVTSCDHSDPKEIHTITYSSLHQTLGSKIDPLIYLNDYSKVIYKNDEAFSQQLGFYKNRLLYISLTYLLVNSGIPVVNALQFISIFFSIATAMLFFFWLIKYYPVKFAAPFAFLILNLSGFYEISSMITPDALNCFVILLIFYLIYEKNSIALAIFLCLLSLFIRPDNIITAVLIISLSYILKIKEIVKDINHKSLLIKIKLFLFRKEIIITLALFCLIILSFILINRFTGNYNWWLTFSHTFIGKYNYPTSQVIDFSIMGIILAWIKGLNPIYAKGFFPFLLILFLYTYKNNFKFDFSVTTNLFLIVPILSIFIHYLAFPLINDRFFIAFYLFSIILISKDIIQFKNVLTFSVKC